MRQRRAKKPLILDLKIKIANTIQHWPAERYDRQPRGFYWRCTYTINGTKYYIYFQRYSRDINRVDYVDIRYADGYKALTVKEIKDLAKFLGILS